jgi:cytoskeletal protein CcmA (bactofilin family)
VLKPPYSVAEWTSTGLKNMRNYNLLWCVWVLWALFIILRLTGISFTDINLKLALLTALAMALLATLVFIYKITRMKKMLSFNKQKKSTNDTKASDMIDQPVPQPQTQPEPASLADVADAIKPIRAKKDTFISNGALFTGVIEGDGNIIVEGKVEGNIVCTHMVRIENSGHVKGEIRAQQIMINGAVEGRCYADSLSIQPKGSMRGDIYADEIAIEKGGIFIGQSQLMQKTPPQTQGAQAKITPLKAAATPEEHNELASLPMPGKQAK